MARFPGSPHIGKPATGGKPSDHPSARMPRDKAKPDDFARQMREQLPADEDELRGDSE